MWYSAHISTYLLDYEISDIYKSSLKGDYKQAVAAAFYTSPFESGGVVSAMLFPPLAIGYGCYFVPWRHNK